MYHVGPGGIPEVSWTLWLRCDRVAARDEPYGLIRELYGTIWDPYGTQKAASWQARRHPGGTQEAARRHPDLKVTVEEKYIKTISAIFLY